MSDLIRHVRHKTCIINFTTPFLDLVLSSFKAILFPRALRFFWSRGLVRFKLSRVALGTKAVMRRRGRRALGSIGNTHVTSSTQRDKGRQKKRTERSLISEGGDGDALPLSSASGRSPWCWPKGLQPSGNEIRKFSISHDRIHALVRTQRESHVC